VSLLFGKGGHGKPVFSRKRRGICRPDGARRMSRIAARPLDHTTAHLPARLVLSQPISLRVR